MPDKESSNTTVELRRVNVSWRLMLQFFGNRNSNFSLITGIRQSHSLHHKLHVALYLLMYFSLLSSMLGRTSCFSLMVPPGNVWRHSNYETWRPRCGFSSWCVLTYSQMTFYGFTSNCSFSESFGI